MFFPQNKKDLYLTLDCPFPRQARSGKIVSNPVLFFTLSKKSAYSDSTMICSKIESTRRLASRHSSESSPNAIFLFSFFRSCSS